MPNYSAIQQFVLASSTQAGALIQQAYLKPNPSNQARRTSPKALHLIEDKTIDQWLIQHIHKTYPEHDILTEEAGLVLGRSRKDSPSDHYRWIIDPIDGSVNFSLHNPFVANAIALEHNGVIEFSVITAPLLGEQFVAQQGQGAWLNNAPIQVSTTTTLEQAYLVSCDGGATDRTEVFSTLIRNYYDQVKDFRKLGSAALECAWVACGRADAYITMTIDPWDVAAGVLLVQEAGGKVTTLTGQAWKPAQSDFLCSNSRLHEAMLARLY